jgi:hypothetical protein
LDSPFCDFLNFRFSHHVTHNKEIFSASLFST